MNAVAMLFIPFAQPLACPLEWKVGRKHGLRHFEQGLPTSPVKSVNSVLDVGVGYGLHARPGLLVNWKAPLPGLHLPAEFCPS